MTGTEMIKTAVTLMGYSEDNVNASSLAVLNQVYADLFYRARPFGSTEADADFVPMTNTSDNINLPARILYDVMPYGVAAFLAQSVSDGDNQQFFIALYNSKRASLTKIEAVKDELPVTEG